MGSYIALNTYNIGIVLCTSGIKYRILREHHMVEPENMQGCQERARGLGVKKWTAKKN
jgi:hypothetical protein